MRLRCNECLFMRNIKKKFSHWSDLNTIAHSASQRESQGIQKTDKQFLVIKEFSKSYAASYFATSQRRNEKGQIDKNIMIRSNFIQTLSTVSTGILIALKDKKPMIKIEDIRN